PKWGLAAAVLAVGLSAGYLALRPGAAPEQTASVPDYSEDQLYAALEAFVSFSEENSEWSAEAF
ncbi:MAG: hypothetical protein HC901_02790, partial [Bdellovibrionaceae bacterium]|nr:hypothetical protein [Pseudobdellovibrionaceae bacterium]